MTATLTETQVGADRVLVTGTQTLVASASQPGAWHDVTHDTCDCKAYQFRGHCRHLDAARLLEEQRRVRAACTCTRCGRITNKLYGGKCAGCISSLDD